MKRVPVYSTVGSIRLDHPEKDSRSLVQLIDFNTDENTLINVIPPHGSTMLS
ncbi:hypothetical protein SynBIOSE41_01725 [Synechococcus sp. BIOS-E4-1]|nr:hypothetical protein SynBIOSE41_01725 [Synechococcus sp. BIOS-E4-1]